MVRFHPLTEVRGFFARFYKGSGLEEWVIPLEESDLKDCTECILCKQGVEGHRLLRNPVVSWGSLVCPGDWILFLSQERQERVSDSDFHAEYELLL